MPGTWSTIKELHKQSTFGAKEGLAFRYFSRPLASFILYFIRKTAVTPNQVTIASLLVGILGSLAHILILPYWGLLLGGALFMLAHVLDALDGQLARHRKAGSEIGMHFDFFIDELKAYLMYGALAIRLYRQHLDPTHPFSFLDPLVSTFGPASILLLGLVGLGGLSVGISCTQFFKLQPWKAAFPKAPEPSPAGPVQSPPPTPFSQARAMAEKAGHFIVDYPSYIILLCLLNRVDLYLLLYTLTVCAYATQALTGISLKLWRVNPYQDAQQPAATSPEPTSPSQVTEGQDSQPVATPDEEPRPD